MPKKLLSDEEIVAAILAQGSITGAAASLNTQYKYINKRMQTPEFKAIYKKAKADIIRSATAKLQSSISSAIDNIVKIMNDEEIAAQTRVNAATTVLQYAARFTQEIDIIERLEAIEEYNRQEEEERLRRI